MLLHLAIDNENLSGWRNHGVCHNETTRFVQRIPLTRQYNWRKDWCKTGA